MSHIGVVALCVVCIVAALAWLPILIRFFRNWQGRKNPISFAIVTMVGLSIYCSLTGIWYFTGNASATWLIAAIVVAELAVCLNFHMSFYWSDKKFGDGRKRPAEEQK